MIAAVLKAYSRLSGLQVLARQINSQKASSIAVLRTWLPAEFWLRCILSSCRFLDTARQAIGSAYVSVELALIIKVNV